MWEQISRHRLGISLPRVAYTTPGRSKLNAIGAVINEADCIDCLVEAAALISRP